MKTEVARLTRQRPAPGTGIVHLGLGAFFRAHGAPMIEEAVSAAGGDWGVIGISLKSPGIRDRLAPQGHVYTAVEMGPAGQVPRVVGILSDVVFAPEDPSALLGRLADPRVRIVSLTVTEKGYCHVPSTGELDLQHPDIRHDIAHALPKSAVGYIVRALAARRAAGLRPFTVLSCDNLPDNGRIVRNVVTGLAWVVDPGLAEWIEAEGCFPSTMVDRIVPATTEEGIAQLEELTGYKDQAPVFHEPFRQWVIEDSFVDGARPEFESVPGVQLVRDVAPFELMKIRMLNGTHSALAYLGYLAGHETICDTVADPVFRAFVGKVWREEIIPTLLPPEGVQLETYAEQLLERYSNPAIRHRTWQIAMDGSQKLPQRMLGTITDNLRSGRKCDGLMLAVAAWMRYVGGTDERDRAIDVRDPLEERLRMLSDGGASAARKVENLLSVQEVFGAHADRRMQEALTNAYTSLERDGARISAEGLQRS